MCLHGGIFHETTFVELPHGKSKTGVKSGIEVTTPREKNFA